MRQQLIFTFLLSLTMTSTCYNGGSEYLQVFKSSNVEIKTLLEDVVQQLKKQNKKAEKMLKHLESQTQKVGEVFQHLKGQNDHLGELLRNLDTQDKHMDLVLQKIRRINESDYNLEADANDNTNRHFGLIPENRSSGIPGTLVQYRDLKKTLGRGRGRNYQRPENTYDLNYEDYDENTFSESKSIFDLTNSGGYTPLRPSSNYEDEDKIFDFSENRKKSHQDFLSFISNTSKHLNGENGEKKPLVFLPHKLIGALLGTDIQIECFVQHHAPSTRTYWRFNGTVVPMANLKYKNSVAEDQVESSLPIERMTLVILDLDEKDIGTYDCVAEDGGDMDSESVMVYILRTLG